MILTETVLNAYINANIMLLFAFALWHLLRYLSNKLNFPLPYIFQLHLLNGVFLAIALSPIAIGMMAALMQLNLIPPDFSMRASDFIIAQYLNGGIDMKASEFEQVIGLRGTLTQNFLNVDTVAEYITVGLFLTGFTALIGNSLFNIIKLRSILRSSYTWRRFGALHILLSDTTFIPFSTRGLNTHYVVIPSGMLAENDDLKMALGHEFQHIRQGDIEWAFVLEALRPFFFWNPVFFFWKRQVLHLRELACDQQLVTTRKFNAKAYCECLLHVCQNSIRKDDRYSIALPSVPFVQVSRPPFGMSSTKALSERIVAIIDPVPNPISRKAFACLLLPTMALVILTSLTIQAPGDWSQDRLMLSTVVNLERLDHVNSFGR
jgi:beta-lactamase regulating signal transducer with metallopeptidase domain